MPRLRKSIDAGATRAKLNDLADAVRREAGRAEADPFDDAMLAAVIEIAEAMKAEADTLAELEARLGRLARRAPR